MYAAWQVGYFQSHFLGIRIQNEVNEVPLQDTQPCFGVGVSLETGEKMTIVWETCLFSQV